MAQFLVTPINWAEFADISPDPGGEGAPTWLYDDRSDRTLTISWEPPVLPPNTPFQGRLQLGPTPSGPWITVQLLGGASQTFGVESWCNWIKVINGSTPGGQLVASFERAVVQEFGALVGLASQVPPIRRSPPTPPAKPPTKPTPPAKPPCQHCGAASASDDDE